MTTVGPPIPRAGVICIWQRRLGAIDKLLFKQIYKLVFQIMIKISLLKLLIEIHVEK